MHGARSQGPRQPVGEADGSQRLQHNLVSVRTVPWVDVVVGVAAGPDP